MHEQAHMNITNLIGDAIRIFGEETESFLPIIERRYDRELFPSTGQYDLFSAQVLYCLIRLTKPDVIIEVSTSSGYSTLIQASALRRNGMGLIHTFELDPSLAKSAQSALQLFGLDEVVRIHTGDARTMSDRIPCVTGKRLLFLDSLHTAEFAQWFIQRWVVDAPEGSLFHAHDCMPESARVRFDDGPPWQTQRLGWLRGIGRRVLGKPTPKQLGHIERRCLPPTIQNGLAATDGVFTTEALLMNQLTSRMSPNDYCYLHPMAANYPQLRASRLDYLTRKRQNQFGDPMEWNETLWLDAVALASAFSSHAGRATVSR